MAPPQLRQQTPNCSLLLIYRPRRDERLSWSGWLTYSGWLTHISGHPSATGRAQDSESSPAKDQRSTAVPHNRLIIDMTLAFALSSYRSHIHVGNMTSSAKPEVHYLLQCRQTMTEQRPRMACVENFTKFGRVVFEIYYSRHTDRQAYKLIAILRASTGGKVINQSMETDLYIAP